MRAASHVAGNSKYRDEDVSCDPRRTGRWLKERLGGLCSLKAERSEHSCAAVGISIGNAVCSVRTQDCTREWEVARGDKRSYSLLRRPKQQFISRRSLLQCSDGKARKRSGEASIKGLIFCGYPLISGMLCKSKVYFDLLNVAGIGGKTVECPSFLGSIFFNNWSLSSSTQPLQCSRPRV